MKPKISYKIHRVKDVIQDIREGKINLTCPGPPFCFHDQAQGAIQNGSRIEKVNSEPEDGHQDGALGVVIGSRGPIPDLGMFMYWVEWDDLPGCHVGVSGDRIHEVPLHA